VKIYSSRLNRLFGSALKWICLAGYLAATESIVEAQNQVDSASRPNILLISIDDLNDWVGFLSGHPLVQTPNLDRLASESVVFSKAYCAVPVCGPSRAAVFTGISPTQTGMYSNANHLTKIFPNAKYLQQDLAENGYHTLGTGKLLHGNQRGPESFDEYGPGFNKWKPLTAEENRITKEELDAPGPFVQHRVQRSTGLDLTFPLNQMPRDRNPRSNRLESFDWGSIDLPEADWSDTQCADWSIQKLGESHDRPFFLGLGFYRPHQPLWAPKKYHDLYPPAEMPLPPHLEEDLDDVPLIGKMIGRLPLTSGSHATVIRHQQWQQAISAYLACISYVDHQLGRVLDALKASPHADQTIVILFSDHGWHLGEKEHWGKFTAWERSARVPFLIHLPPSLQRIGYVSSSVHDSPVSLMDIYPTVLDLLGIEKPPRLSGTSLAPLLRGENLKLSRIVSTSVGPGNHSLRSDRWRFIQYFDGSQELYDHSKDPLEQTNLANHPDHLALIRSFQSHLPVDPKISHFVRIGEWKALVSKIDQSISLFGPGVNNVDGAKDIAEAQPEIMLKVQDYLATNPEAPRYLTLPVN
jgi:arylsulfatase A-like enzyme